jgi:hypothetical protein
MRSRRTLALLLLAFVVASPAALAYNVVDGHPRLFVLADDVPALRAKCQGVFAAEFDDIESWCDEHINDSFPFAPHEYEWHLSAYSFAWLVGGDSRYAARAKAIASDIVNRDAWDSIEAVEGLSRFFDWCYDAMTPFERSIYGSTLAEAAQWFIDEKTWTANSSYHGKLSFLRGLALPGIALYDEGINNAVATACCDTFHRHVFGPQFTLCCLDEVGSDGSYFEGDYNFNRVYSDGREGFEAWAMATGESAWEQSSNLANLGRYYLYEIGPRAWGKYGFYGFMGSKQGDSHTHSIPHGAFRKTLYNLASRYRDPHAQWLASEIARQGATYMNAWEWWRLIVWYDPTVPEEAPTNLPHATLFADMGTAYMRSGWDISDDSNDIYAVFRCETFPAIHTHPHQNHFMIMRGNDLLAIDSGHYDTTVSSHYRNYFARTIAHNTITVFDPSETTFGSYANDGGQKPAFTYDTPVRCGHASQPQYERGEIVAFEDGEAFTYVKGDATPAYDPSKLSHFTREFVYLKPDIFVIFDRVVATSPSFEKKWLLHSIGQPQISGQVVTVTEGDSKLFIRTVLPSPSTITKVGGPGHEFEVNGVNYPPNGTPEEDAGSWRIEVSPTSQATEHFFLHVLYACDAGVTSMPEVSLIDAGEMVGVDVGGRVVVFSKTGVEIDSVEYEFGGP